MALYPRLTRTVFIGAVGYGLASLVAFAGGMLLYEILAGASSYQVRLLPYTPFVAVLGIMLGAVIGCYSWRSARQGDQIRGFVLVMILALVYGLFLAKPYWPVWALLLLFTGLLYSLLIQEAKGCPRLLPTIVLATIGYPMVTALAFSLGLAGQNFLLPSASTAASGWLFFLLPFYVSAAVPIGLVLGNYVWHCSHHGRTKLGLVLVLALSLVFAIVIAQPPLWLVWLLMLILTFGLFKLLVKVARS